MASSSEIGPVAATFGITDPDRDPARQVRERIEEAMDQPEPPTNLVIVSDTHGGCQHALCGRDPIPLDGGGLYYPSAEQIAIANLWEHILWEWIPAYTHGEPFDLLHNAEAIEGVHHGATTPITFNLTTQRRIAHGVLEPLVNHPQCRLYYHIRGTEAHSGKSGQEEEALAQDLGAVPEVLGRRTDGSSIQNYSRYFLWKRVGNGLVHATHHIGTTSSASYESTAVFKELIEAFTSAARWGERPPDIVVRSHRHQAMMIAVPAALATNEAWSIVTPAWQNKTPYGHKTAARNSPAQFGAMIIRKHGDGAIRPAARWWVAKRPRPE